MSGYLINVYECESDVRYTYKNMMSERGTILEWENNEYTKYVTHHMKKIKLAAWVGLTWKRFKLITWTKVNIKKNKSVVLTRSMI
jgi:hypothetical protein